jgi:hypothetical protein
MTTELTEITSITPWSVTLVSPDQRLKALLAQSRATNGDTTQSVRRTTRTSDGLRLVARSKKPAEATAPINTAI